MKTRIHNRFIRLFLGLSPGPLLAIFGVMAWHAYTVQTERDASGALFPFLATPSTF